MNNPWKSLRMKKLLVQAKKLIWCKGLDWMYRLNRSYAKLGHRDMYSIRDCRIGAMAFEAGWKAALRARRAS